MGLLPNHFVNRSGHVLKNLIDTYGYKMMNDLEPTYFCNSSSREELLDICLMKETQLNKSVLWYTEETIGSDHIPTILDQIRCTK